MASAELSPVDENRRLLWLDTQVHQQGRAMYDASHTCPCCHYPTLSVRHESEICFLCGWEDDGQDDPRADEIWGDPNKNYSLTEARANWQQYRTMYRPMDEEMFRRTRYRMLPGGTKLDLIRVKEDIMRVFDALPSAGAARPELLGQLNQLMAKLR